ncbi:MAG TPA: putative peptidoglycan glycosyltransferase FtsW [Acidimicrobiia bacterium]|nr:putative peptidoglycan glycosyltransferase FtsW [Acidimicrobiia bacterium]
MKSLVARRRRTTELGLGLLAVIIGVAGYLLVELSQKLTLPPDLWVLLAVVIGLFAVAHLAVRAFAPRADATLLPLVALLNGIGFVMISRLDKGLARTQSVWTAVAIAAFVATLVIVRRVRVLEQYRYTFAFLGIAFLLLPLAPGIGREVNGARLWARVGPVTFQPGEIAKVLFVVFFAAYLVEKRELLSSGSRRIGRMMLPDPKHLGPLVLAWAVAILLMTGGKDLGSSLLFFALFTAMLYIATARSAYLVAALVLFVGASVVAYNMFSHVTVRVSTWINPWPTSQGKGYQLVQSLFAFGSGGFAGTGLGLGSPQKIPNASTDFIFSAIGEELGLIGTIAVVIAFLLLVGTGFRIARQTDRPFSKLFAAGLSVILGVQMFVIVGGVSRLIPLTGITLPFISYGGSSLVANWVIIALLLRISDETVAEAEAAANTRAVPVAVP